MNSAIDSPLSVQPSADSPSILPLRVENVSFQSGGTELIHNLNLELVADNRTIILGTNGAGKSLLLRLCHGLLAPTRGAIHWAHEDSVEVQRQQAMVFQRPVLLRRSVIGNITYALAVRNVPRAERLTRARIALERTGLQDIAHRPARVLSGGEQQRLALARAWALEPRVLFLDEPTANLDPGATRAFEAVVDQINRAGTKIIMTTHDLGQAHRLADEIVFLHRGQIVEQTDAKTFFEEPASEEARAFLAGDLLW